MAKPKKTSIQVDPELWKEFLTFVIKKTGSSRRVSQELESAIKDYLKRQR